MICLNILPTPKSTPHHPDSHGADRSILNEQGNPRDCAALEWKSGEIGWLIDAIGNGKGLDAALKVAQNRAVQGATARPQGTHSQFTEANSCRLSIGK